MILKSRRIEISPLTMEDAKSMRGWGVHESVLFSDYNFPYEGDQEIKKWFKYKTFSIRNKYFGVHNEEGKLIGYLGIKDRKFFGKSSFLGIVFDPDHMNLGYGTESLRVFLEYYFEVMNMKTLFLEVAEFNERALKVYDKMGFVPVAYYADLFPVEGVDKDHPHIQEAKSYFVFKDEKIYNYIYKMKLTRKRYREFKDRRN